MQKKIVHEVVGSHYHNRQDINISRLPIDFERKHCDGYGFKNCRYYKKIACPGTCKWVEEMMNPKRPGKISNLETSTSISSA